MKAALAIIASLLLGTCSQPPSTLDQILSAGELRVVTLNNPSTYYLGGDGPQGPEYDLAAQFAADLGVALNIYSVRNPGELRKEVSSGRAHIAAAGLAREQAAPAETSYGPAYQLVKEHLIYRSGAERPRNLLEASRNGQIEVATDSPHAATLARLRTTSPDLSWVENPDAEIDSLLYRLSRNEFDYTIADSNEFAIGRSFHPDIAIAFSLTQGKSIAWLVNTGDTTLLSRVTSFFSVIESDGRLATVLDAYYSKKASTPVLHARNFIIDVKERLPLYLDWFKESASAVGMDWRMLAAIGYQESKWIPDATSPTGVRGLMMLTDDTASSLGVVDRLDPQQSILGGARYFIYVRKMIPGRIKEPDRTWFALACYNMGFGHIEDARVFAQADGKDPDKWEVVREYLPLLTQEKWYSQAKRGYARGWEPVQFVDSIKLYMSMLDWVGAEGGLASKIEAMEGAREN
ncbi:MAG: membrane-bound lytic murein transglycosylase MltF [Steroidobacteraceae bacterium]